MQPNPTGDIRFHLTQAWRSASEIAKIQMEVIALKTTRVAVLAVIAMLALAVAVGFGVYGLVLLNNAVDIVLSGPEFPAWLSPLARGLVFVAPITVGLIVAWNNYVGYGAAELTPETEQKEAARGARI